MTTLSPTVYLVGAGPGDLGLVTLKARELVEQAEVIVYDYLCNAEMLRWAQPSAEIIYAGKAASQHTLTQEQINQLLIDRAKQGKRVVRLKGGDPYVFGRGGEEAQEIVRAGLDFQVVPGVTSAVAAPAYAGIPITHREHASMVTFVTGHEDPNKEESSIPWKQLAHLGGTLVFLMGVERLRRITEQLLDQCADPNLPVALVRWGTTARQESIEGTLATIADIAEERAFRPPAIIVVGSVVKLRRELNWFESLPLFGQRVVVTRTREQSSRLSEMLKALGADTLEIPTLQIRQTPWSPERSEALGHLPELFDWMVFTSPNGVDAFFEKLLETHGDVRILGGIKLAAVGPATVDKLKFWHLKAALVPPIYRARELAEALLAEFKSKLQRVLVVQGNKNDPELEQILTEAGHNVTAWGLYENLPPGNANSVGRVRYEREGAHWILFASSSAVEHWHNLNLAGGGGLTPRVACMGPVTSATLRKLGYENWVEAPEATIPGLIKAVCEAVVSK